MSAGVFDVGSRAPQRVGLAAVVLWAHAMDAGAVWEMRHRAPFSVRHDTLIRLLPPSAWFLILLNVVFLVCLWRFTQGRNTLTAGGVAVACTALVAQWGTELFGSPSRNLYIPSATFFGWLCGVAYLRDLASRSGAAAATLRQEEVFGEAGALGVFAALYVSSASSKLLAAGGAWVHPDTLRFLILSQKGLFQGGWIDAYRGVIIEHPAAATALSALTLLIEGGAFLLLAGPRWRRLWCGLIFLLHLNIIVLCTMPYLESMALAVVFGVAWRARTPPSTDDALASPHPWTPSWRTALIVALVLVATWTLPVGWRPTHGDTDRAPDAPARAGGPAPRAR
ncbi:MAG: hypothetical protein U0325_18460 [Polyangiales bacterium]